MPAPGKLVRFVLPSGPGLRVDTGFTEGDVISADFDPLIAKIIAWGPDRKAAIARLSRALEHTRIVVEGGTSNLSFLRTLLAREDVRAGEVDIGLVDRLRLEPPVGAGIACWLRADRFLATGDRANGENRHRIEAGETLGVYRMGRDTFRVFGAGGAVTVKHRSDGPYQSWLDIAGTTHRVERAPGDINYAVDSAPSVAEASGGLVAAPSAALVLNIPVSPGDNIEVGQCVAILESMKMEVRVNAAVAGTVSEVLVKNGGQVKTDRLWSLLRPKTMKPPRLPRALHSGRPMMRIQSRLLSGCGLRFSAGTLRRSNYGKI